MGDTAFRAYQRWQARGVDTGAASDGLPAPPAFLRVLTAGEPGLDVFLRVGVAAAEDVLRLADGHGGAGDRVLEFGVGCGRVARTVARRVPAFDGCDIDGRLVDWAAANLPGRYVRNRLDPPLPYPDAAFTLVYALSVFTHMHEPHARAWLAELARVVRPGGLAILSFFDERLRQAGAVEEPLLRDGYAMLRDGAEGSNLMCGYFTAEGFAQRAAPSFQLLETVPSDQSGTAQAWAVFRRAG